MEMRLEACSSHDHMMSYFRWCSAYHFASPCCACDSGVLDDSWRFAHENPESQIHNKSWHESAARSYTFLTNKNDTCMGEHVFHNYARCSRVYDSYDSFIHRAQDKWFSTICFQRHEEKPPSAVQLLLMHVCAQSVSEQFSCYLALKMHNKVWCGTLNGMLGKIISWYKTCDSQ